jgi:cell division septation protein DedD
LRGSSFPFFRALTAALAAAVILAAPAPAEAQSAAADLARTERLVEEGRFAQARELLEGWWNSGAQGASRQDLQTGIWLRALLTVDPDMADLDYRRLVVEFPGGPNSDEALLRLSRGAEARGDLLAARRYLSILVRDYPDSPHRPEARSLLARIPEGATGVVEPAPGRVTGPSEVRDGPRPTPEVRDGPRPTPEVRRDPDEAGPPREARPEGDRTDPGRAGALPPPDAAPYTVQLGAFSTGERARALAARLEDQGISVRIVFLEGSDLYRVRSGAFETRDGVEDGVARLRSMGFEASIATDRERERPLP